MCGIFVCWGKIPNGPSAPPLLYQLLSLQVLGPLPLKFDRATRPFQIAVVRGHFAVLLLIWADNCVVSSINIDVIYLNTQ